MIITSPYVLAICCYYHDESKQALAGIVSELRTYLPCSHLVKVQSAVVCDLSQTYATKSELETVKQMVSDDISNLKNVVTSNSNITSMMISDSLPDPVSPSVVSPFSPTANAVNTSHSNLGFDSHSRSNSVKRSDTILFASDSLLNRMSIKRMNVGNYHSVKLTKP